MSALRLPPLSASHKPSTDDPVAVHLEHPPAHVGWSTYPSAEAAEAVARTLVDERLAACVQVSGPIRSFYRWEGRTRDDPEWLLTVKFTHATIDEVSRRIKETHPYASPQWLVVRVDHALPGYLAWLNGY